MVHPLVDCFLMTPICPRSLSFRPIILPSFVDIELQIAPECRSPGFISFDGRDEIPLAVGDRIKVTKALHGLPSIDRTDPVTDWLSDVNDRLRFNTAYAAPPPPKDLDVEEI